MFDEMYERYVVHLIKYFPGDFGLRIMNNVLLGYVNFF